MLTSIQGLNTVDHTQVGQGRNVGRRMVVARSNCSRIGIERRSNSSRIVTVTTALGSK